jgi:hypothetical protein
MREEASEAPGALAEAMAKHGFEGDDAMMHRFKVRARRCCGGRPRRRAGGGAPGPGAAVPLTPYRPAFRGPRTPQVEMCTNQVRPGARRGAAVAGPAACCSGRGAGASGPFDAIGAHN